MTGPFHLVHLEARIRALQAVQEAADGYIVRISEPTRSTSQNAALHAMLTDIAEQAEWCGKKFSVDIWKRLCTAAWLREHNEQPMMIPALDGKGFDVIFERTSKLTVKQCSELIEWIACFAAEQGVKLSTKGE